ncbi:hypothetical protein FOA52_011748 [Chlamydomonas sp. UWO 241]|nr:hypothetical protein FOA52_011748 [Chlamydomonas sp. UWO 241]
MSYGGWALLYITAADANCGNFPRSSPKCSFPCQDNGEVCRYSGSMLASLYACNGSQARDDAFCMNANKYNSSLCRDTPACTEQASGDCMPKWKASMSFYEYIGYIGDWGTCRRDVWGCCIGSNTRWMTGTYCDRFSSIVDACEELPECYFRYDGTCVWRTRDLMEDYFGAGNLTDLLVAAAGACDALGGNRTACESHGAVTPDADVVRAALAIDLQAFNAPVNDSECVVWEAGEYY